MSSRTESQMVEVDSNLMKKAICEECENSNKDLFVCKLCLSFCCEHCTILHSCESNLGNGEEIPSFHPLYTQSEQSSSQLLSNNMLGVGGSQMNQFSKKEQHVNCQRCLVSTAIKKCLSCKMSVYCQYCYRYIHSASKLKNHQFYQLKKSKQTLIVKPTSQFKRPNSIKPLNFKQLGIQTKRNSLDEYQLKEIIQKVQIIKTNLSIEKRQLQTEMKESMILIKREFDQLIDQIKMKKIQIQLKVQETYKISLQKCLELDKKLSIEQKISNNIQISLINSPSISVDISLFDSKLRRCSIQVQSILQILDFNPIKQPLQSKLTAFTDELSNIKQRISKIDIKNSFYSLQSCCNSFISLDKSQSMLSSKIESKSHKSSLNVSTIKSIQKGLISTFSITSPRKSQLNMPKIQKDPKSPILSKFNLNQSVGINSTAEQLLRQEKLNSLQFSTNLKKTALKKGIENPQEKPFLPKGLMSPKLSAKKLLKSSQNNSKFRPSFAGENIQKTKNMINEIRKEMTEFTYRFKTQKQVQERCDTQLQSLDISSLSIESCKKKMSLA